MPGRGPRAFRWVFTHNNPSDYHELAYQLFADEHCHYLTFGREVGDSGTPHLQGFFILKRRRYFSSLRELIGECHLEVARGTPEQCVEYCHKDGDVFEFGSVPTSQQGKRSDFHRYRDWLVAYDGLPSEALIADQWPALYGRYRTSVLRMREVLCPEPELETGVPSGWQDELVRELELDADDRTVRFIVDEEGGKGKTWLCRFYLTKHDDAQVLGPGKRDDLAHAIDPSKRVFFFNIPRGSMQFLQYGVLESLKDRIVFSPKYDSKVKKLKSKVHVIVLCNEHPDMHKMSADRYNVREL